MRRFEILGGTRKLLFSIVGSIGIVTVLPVENGFAGGQKHGPIYRSLDALAGGIEKVIDVAASAKWRNGSRATPLCDDGCDAILMDDLMTLPHGDELQPHEFGSSGWDPDMVTPQVDAPQMTPPAQHPAHSPKRLMAPRMPSPPADTPRLAHPAPAPARPIPAPTPRTGDDEWLESFSTEPRAQSAPAVPRRPLEAQPKTKPGSGTLRNPSETFDSLPDPFSDDPQSNRASKPMNRAASYWEPW